MKKKKGLVCYNSSRHLYSPKKYLYIIFSTYFIKALLLKQKLMETILTYPNISTEFCVLYILWTDSEVCMFLICWMSWIPMYLLQFPQLSIFAPKPDYFETNMRQHILHIHICMNRRCITKILLQQEEKWQRSISKFPSQPVVGWVTLGRRHLWCPFPFPDTPRHPGPSPNSKVDVLLLLSTGQSTKPPQRYSLNSGVLWET